MEKILKKILLVEDDENDIIITKRKLARSTAPIGEIIVAHSIEETKNILNNQNDIRLVLLDLNLPDSRGINTVEVLLSFYKGIVIVLTSIDDTLIGVEAIRKGADDFLVKTQLDERELGRSIYFTIERRKSKDAQERMHENLNKLENLIAAGDKGNVIRK